MGKYRLKSPDWGKTDLQRRMDLYREYFRSIGYSDDEINKKISEKL